jgi:hypothetical protein
MLTLKAANADYKRLLRSMEALESEWQRRYAHYQLQH